MIGVLSAALILSWGAIALLAFGFANLTMQIRELQSRGGAAVGDPHPELAAPAPGRRTVVLGVADGCGTCTEVSAAWLDLTPALRADGHRTVLVSLDDSTHWQPGDGEFLTGAQLSSPFLLAYQPALLLLDERGELLSAEPVGSAAGLASALTSSLASAPASSLSEVDPARVVTRVG
jgi:hypothetical protein